MVLFLIACGSDDDPSIREPLDTDTEELVSTDSGMPDPGTTKTDGCNDQAVTDLTPAELDKMLANKDFVFINVHVPYAGEIPGTDQHISYQDTDALEKALSSEPTTKAVLYCKTGPMSETATNNLADRGYCNLYDMPAGMNGWEADGYLLK